MSPTPSSVEEHRQQVRLFWVVLSLAAGLVVVALVVNYVQQHQRRTPRVQTVAPTATPRSFQDMIGSVTAVQGSALSIDVIITDDSGQPHHRLYTVSVDEHTIIKSLTGDRLSDLSQDQLRAGDQVQVASDVNLALTDHCTATKIFKLLTS